MADFVCVPCRRFWTKIEYLFVDQASHPSWIPVIANHKGFLTDVKEKGFPNVVGVFCCYRYRDRLAWTRWSVPFRDASLGLILLVERALLSRVCEYITSESVDSRVINSIFASLTSLSIAHLVGASLRALFRSFSGHHCKKILKSCHTRGTLD